MSKNIGRILNSGKALFGNKAPKQLLSARGLHVEVSEEGAGFNRKRLEKVFDRDLVTMIKMDIEKNNAKRFLQVAASLQEKRGQLQEGVGQLAIQNQFNSKVTVASAQKIFLQEEFLREYVKLVESEPDDRPTIVGNLNNRDRKVVFIAEKIKFDFDFTAKSFSIQNLGQLREDYKKEFFSTEYDFKKDEAVKEWDFKNYLNSMLDSMQSALSEMRGVAGATIDDYHYNRQDPLDGFFNILSKINSKVHKAKLVNTNSENRETHLVNSPHRHDPTKNFGNRFLQSFSTSFIISSIIEDAAKKAYGENCEKFFSQLKFSPQLGDVAFPRDQSVCVDGVFYQTDLRVAENMAQKSGAPHELLQLKSHAADLHLSGFKVKQNIPFDAKGGNMIITKNGAGKKVLIAAVSDAYYSDEGKFKGGYMIDAGGNLVNNSHVLYGLFDKYPSLLDKYPVFCESIKSWGRSIGCDEVVVLDRNMEGAYKDKFNQLYHLDVFCGALPNGFVVVNSAAITAENLSELSRVFGEDKIISMSQEEHKEICSNFIVFDNLVVMTSPKTPQSFIEKLNDRGFDVYVPAVYLTYPETIKAGWPAGVRCMTSTYDGLQQTKERDGDKLGKIAEIKGIVGFPSASRAVDSGADRGVIVSV